MQKPEQKPKPRKPGDRKHVNLFGYYCDNMVKSDAEMPKGPHWAALLFKTESEYTPGYDKGDDGSYSDKDTTEYYVFHDEADLKDFILLYNEEKAAGRSKLRGMSFFKVAGIGKSTVTVSVAVAVEQI